MKDKSYEHLQKEVVTLKASIDASYDGIHILDNEGKTILINKACERIEGITFNDIGNKTISQLVKEGFYDESITLQVLETKKNVTRVQTVKNGKKCWLLVCLSLMILEILPELSLIPEISLI